MEVAPYSIGVSISFPPDTDTPQLQAEVPERGEIQSKLASFGTVFKPEQISKDVWSGVEYGNFQITHGLDGFMLGNLTAGMSPVHNMWDGAKQVCILDCCGINTQISISTRLLFCVYHFPFFFVHNRFY